MRPHFVVNDCAVLSESGHDCLGIFFCFACPLHHPLPLVIINSGGHQWTVVPSAMRHQARMQNNEQKSTILFSFFLPSECGDIVIYQQSDLETVKHCVSARSLLISIRSGQGALF